jgi:hypothetical protein
MRRPLTAQKMAFFYSKRQRGGNLRPFSRVATDSVANTMEIVRRCRSIANYRLKQAIPAPSPAQILRLAARADQQNGS